GDKWTFGTNGLQMSWTSACGCSAVAFTYTDGDSDGQSDDLRTQTNIDGSVATFGYAAGKLDHITEPGTRTVTLGYNTGDLASIKNPDGGLHSFSYDGGHRPIDEQFGTLRNSWGYSNNALATITWGTTSTSTLTPAMAQGVGALVAGGARAVLT